MTDSHISSEHEPPKGRLPNLVTLWRFMARYPLQLTLASLFLIISSAATLIVPWTLGDIVDAGFIESASEQSGKIFTTLGVIIAVLALSTALRFYFVTWIGERVVADIRQSVYERLVTLSPEFFEDNPPGEIVSRLTADTTLVQSIVGSSVSVWARNILIALGGTIALFVMSPRLMMIVFVVIPIILGTIVYAGRRIRNLSRKSQDRVADVGAKAAESLAALPVVQAFTRESTEVSRFGARVEEAFEVARKRILVRAWVTGILVTMIFSTIALMMYGGVMSVADGSMTAGEIVRFLAMSLFVAGAFGALSEVYSELQRAAGAAGRLAELLASRSPIAAPPAPQQLPETVKGHIRFENVSFHYPTKPDQKALDTFSLELKPGEMVALVGPSGAGKSTVLQMMLRFYDPQSGHVSMDGFDIKNLRPEDFRDQIALVPQDTIVFADTVAENIRYGRLDANDEDLRSAAKAAAALEFIEAMPDGFATQIGERGARLSGGQRQRLAIARAILRDAPVLLLDEATSALDAESERKVQTALEHLMEGRTTLVIAHRLATVKQADRIIVMDEGRIVAEGTHENLVKEDGLYQRLAALQFGTN